MEILAFYMDLYSFHIIDYINNIYKYICKSFLKVFSQYSTLKFSCFLKNVDFRMAVVIKLLCFKLIIAQCKKEGNKRRYNVLLFHITHLLFLLFIYILRPVKMLWINEIRVETTSGPCIHILQR